MIRAALFDLDETLLDRTASLRAFVTWQASGMLGKSVDDTAGFIERFIELDQNGMVWKDKVYTSLITEFNITDFSVDELLDAYLQYFCQFCRPRSGATEAIHAFHRAGYKLGLVSNGKSPFQERNFAALSFSELFDCVVVSEAVGIRKPEKAIFELACENVNADICSSIFIGDNPVADIQGAKSAGLKTIYVPVGMEYTPCSYADSTFPDMAQLVGHTNLSEHG